MVKSKQINLGLMIKFRYPIFLSILATVILFSLGKTLNYHFFTDDYPFIFYLKNNFNFGWPYDSILFIFRPVYLLFGNNPLPYFATALVTYFLSSIAVFFFAKVLTRNVLIASASSLIFATGYIGLDHFGMIAVSIINNLNTINVCLTLIFLILWIDRKKIRFYLLALLAFSISIWLFPHRAYVLTLFIPTLWFLETFKIQEMRKAIKELGAITILYLPFLLIAIQRGVLAYGSGEKTGTLANVSIVEKFFSVLDLFFFGQLLSVLGKFIAFPLLGPFSGFNQPNVSDNIYLISAIVFIFLTISVLLFLSKTKNSVILAKALLVSVLLTIQSYVGIMLLHTDFDYNGPINRYLPMAAPFFAISISLLLFYLIHIAIFIKSNLKIRLYFLLISLFVLSLSLLARNYEDLILYERSKPAKEFFRELKEYVPSIDSDSFNVFYFDNASYYPVSSRFGNVLQSAAMDNSVNLAVPYDVSPGSINGRKVPLIDSIKIVNNFEDFLRLIFYPPKNKKIVYYSFYKDESKLMETTKKLFHLLEQGKSTNIVNDEITYLRKKGNYSAVIKPKNVSSLTSLKVSLGLRAGPISYSEFKYPFYFGDESQLSLSFEAKKRIFGYLLSREKYYRSVKVDVESIHIAKKNPASLLVDDNTDTSWISDQSRWEVDIKPWIKLDLSEVRKISRLILTQSPNARAIGDFNVSASMDGMNWQEINLTGKTNLSDERIVVVDFEPISAMFVKLSIEEMLKGDGPGLDEIEIVETDFSDIDINSALVVKNNPFGNIKGPEDLALAYDYLSDSAKLKIKILRNKDDPISPPLIKELPISIDGSVHTYEFNIPAGGTVLKEIVLEAGYPVELFLESVLIENKTKMSVFEDIRKKCEEFENMPEWKNPFDCS